MRNVRTKAAFLTHWFWQGRLFSSNRPGFTRGNVAGTVTTISWKVVKIGLKVCAHALDVVVQMAEAAEPRDLLSRILDLINGLQPRNLVSC